MALIGECRSNGLTNNLVFDEDALLLKQIFAFHPQRKVPRRENVGLDNDALLLVFFSTEEDSIEFDERHFRWHQGIYILILSDCHRSSLRHFSFLARLPGEMSRFASQFFSDLREHLMRRNSRHFSFF